MIYTFFKLIYLNIFVTPTQNQAAFVYLQRETTKQDVRSNTFQ